MKNSTAGISKKMRKLCLIILMSLLFCTGCSGKDKIKIVLTTGFEKDELFRIEEMSCNEREMMIYLTNVRNQYKEAYGEDIFNNSDYGQSLSENVKEMVLADISRIKAMNLFAGEYGVSLDAQEKEDAHYAAERYLSSLSEQEIKLLDADQKLIAGMYEEYMLANKIYYYIIRDVMPVISDDEARTITVSRIMIKTHYYDIKGVAQPYSKEAKKDLYGKLQLIKEDIAGGEDFTVAASKISEAEVTTFSFRKGEGDKHFEEAAFNLGTGEVSDILETEEGYVLIKCLNAYDKEETDKNKEVILNKRKKEAFNEDYDRFAKGLTKMLNEDLYNHITPLEDEALTTSSFYDVINEVMEQK